MQEGEAGSVSEWRQHWPLVLACFAGTSLMSALHGAIGLLFEPLIAEFGWSRTEISAGVSISAFVIMLLTPFVGVLADRLGGRPIVLPGLILTMGAICLLTIANGSSTQWLVLWGLVGIAASSLNTIVWVRAVVLKFDRERSMAIAIVLGGTTFAAMVAPILSQWLTDTYGWQATFLGIGLGWGGITFLLSFLFFDSGPSGRGSQTAGKIEVSAPGLAISEAARSARLWRIGLSGLILVGLSSAFYTHKAPMLVEAGLTRVGAAWLTGFSGAAAIAGKLFAGWAMKRWHGGTVGAILVALSGIPLVFLLDHFATPFLIVVSIMTISFAGGAKVQIGAFLTSIYAGQRNYGAIYGVMSGVLAVGSALGPVLGGLAYDAVGNYSLFIYVGVPITLVGAALLLQLGPYPDWSLRSRSEGGASVRVDSDLA